MLGIDPDLGSLWPSEAIAAEPTATPGERAAEAALRKIGALRDTEPVQAPVPTGPVPSVFDDAFVDDTLDEEEEPPHARPK